jgi:two-component system, chemotaxis family, response regulator WspF
MKIAIVNDVMLAAEAVRRVVASAPGHQVAWVARDGLEAVERCATERPDLILMDLMMPRLDGVEATRRIMASTPCAIVVVTASVADNSSKVFEAMGAGALDAVNTPVLEHPSAQDGAEALLAKIETINRLLGGGLPRSARANEPAPLPQDQDDFLVAIGASAGGPAALARVLGNLPGNFPAPIVIIQHVDVQFAQGLAEWLDSQTPLHVRLAQDGDRPHPGTVLLAGKDNHLVFTSPVRLGYTRQPMECSYRPSVDVFFQSVARFWKGDLVAALLTGMGRDGAEGLQVLRDYGHHTIAQDAASCAVYGMPKAAAELNAASEILPLDRIGPRLVRLLAQRKHPHG